MGSEHIQRQRLTHLAETHAAGACAVNDGCAPTPSLESLSLSFEPFVEYRSLTKPGNLWCAELSAPRTTRFAKRFPGFDNFHQSLSILTRP